MLRYCLALCLPLALSFTLTGADWPRFRGPNGTGLADGSLPKVDPKAALWKVPITGRGVSSPIIVGGKIFLTSSTDDGTKRLIYCLDAATGKTIWTKELFAKKAKAHDKSSMASGSPAADSERLYVPAWDGNSLSLICFNHDGKELWQQPLGGFVSQHGPGHSPMLYNGLVFISVDEDGDKGGKAMLYAFDAKTGERKWAAIRKPYRASYATPFILERKGKPAELVLGTTTAISSYDPASGKALWSYPVQWPDGKMPLRVVGSPVYADGVIVLYCGDGGGDRYTLAIDLEKTEQPAMSWELKKGPTPYVPCMIAKDGLLFWVADNGVPCCAEAKTGKMLWDELRLSSKDVTASPIVAGNEMMIISEKGEVFVVATDKKFKLIRQDDLGEGVFASPALVDGKLYIRGLSHLYCFGEK
jgi:outer membrane protein assembly factor BamB